MKSPRIPIAIDTAAKTAITISALLYVFAMLPIVAQAEPPAAPSIEPGARIAHLQALAAQAMIAAQTAIAGGATIQSAAMGAEPVAAITDTDCSDFSGLFPDVFDDQPENEWGTKDDACDPWPKIDDRP